MGGGGNVGGANFLLTADAQDINKELTSLAGRFKVLADNINTTIAGIGRGELFDVGTLTGQIKTLDTALRELKSGTKGIIPEGEAAKIQQVLEAQKQFIQTQLGVARTAEQVGFAVSKEAAAVQQAGVVITKATAEEARLNQLRAAGVPIVSRTTKEIQTYGNVVAHAATENAKLTKAAELQTGIFGKLRGVLDGVSGGLAKAGLTLRDVSIILGSGLLSGGIALIAREAIKAVQAVANFTINLAKLGAELEHTQALIGLTFGPAAEDIDNFAAHAAQGFGLSEQAALSLAGTLGNIFQQLGATKQAAADLALESIKVAEGLRETSFSGASLADIAKKVTEFIQGQTAALKDEGIGSFTAQQALKEYAAEHHKTVGVLTAGEKARVLFSLAQEEVNRRTADGTAITESARKKQEEFTAALDTLKATLGEALAPILLRILDDLVIFARVVTDDVKAIQKFAEEHEGLIKALKLLGAALAGPLKPLIDLVTGLDRVLQFLGRYQKETDEAAVASKDVAGALDELGSSEDSLADKTDQVADALTRLTRAQEDFATKRAKAALQLARAEEDGTRKVKRALRDRRDAYRDQDRAITDANNKVKDVQLQNFRDIRDAEEKLSDAQRDNNKTRVKDAQDFGKAIQQRADNILDATLAVEAAQRHGDAEAENAARIELTRAKRKDDIKEKEKASLEDAAARALELFRLQRDLDEARVDADAKLADAKEDLRRTIEDQDEKIVKAEEGVTDAIRERDRANADALQNLKDTERETQRILDDALLAYERLGGAAEDAAAKVKALADETKRLRDILLNPVFQDPVVKGSALDALTNPTFSNDPNINPLSGTNPNAPGGTNSPFLGPPSTQPASKTTIIINEAHDPEATAAAVDRRLTRNLV